MRAIATITVPFFAIIFFGYLAARLRWVPPEAVPAFNGFLLYFAVPALLFRLVSEMTVVDFFQSGYLITYSVAGIFTLLVIVTGALMVFKARLRDAAFYGLAGSVTNVGYLGIPLVVALLGERAAGPAVMFDHRRSDGDGCGRTRIGTVRNLGRTRLDQRYGRGRTARTHQPIS